MRLPFNKYLTSVALSLLVLMQAGCGGDDDSSSGGSEPPPSSSTPTPTPTAVGTPDGEPTSANIGAAGGTITTPDGKTKLVIPAGALSAVTTITIQPITNNAHGSLGKAYRLTPEGQTFTKPVQLTFTYTDDDLAGTVAEALGIAFQRSDGLWQWVEDPDVSTVAKTVTVSTTHFSDWSKVKGFQILPNTDTVETGKTLSLKVVSCYGKPIPSETVQQGYPCDQANEAKPWLYVTIDKWSVNGVAGGSPNTGTVAGGQFGATFTAPATKPNAAEVAVSAEMNSRASPGEKHLLISNITITEPAGDYVGTVEYDNNNAFGKIQVTWTKIGEVDGVALYSASGSVQGTTNFPGCNNQTFSYPLVTENDPSDVAYNLMVYPDNHPVYPKYYVFDLQGVGNDIVLDCSFGSNVTLTASFLTKVVVGQLTSGTCPLPPTYIDKRKLTGTYSCEPFLNNASWTFTAP